MTYVDEVFASVPPSEWSGPPLAISDALALALVSWPTAAVERCYDRPADVAARIATSDTRCAAMWAARQGPDAEPWAVIAARYGYVRVETAQNAIKKWRQKQPK